MGYGGVIGSCPFPLIRQKPSSGEPWLLSVNDTYGLVRRETTTACQARGEGGQAIHCIIRSTEELIKGWPKEEKKVAKLPQSTQTHTRPHAHTHKPDQSWPWCLSSESSLANPCRWQRLPQQLGSSAEVTQLMFHFNFPL